jgi:predicted RNA-binding Zn-ribbon protein involved in translation (DUF1610 family)
MAANLENKPLLADVRISDPRVLVRLVIRAHNDAETGRQVRNICQTTDCLMGGLRLENRRKRQARVFERRLLSALEERVAVVDPNQSSGRIAYDPRYTIDWWLCPACGSHDIRREHKRCSECGARLEWRVSE